MFCCCGLLCPFGGSFAAMERNWFAILVKLGLSDGSEDQHLSISDFHSGSQDSGTGGLKVLLTIPPALCVENRITESGSDSKLT